MKTLGEDDGVDCFSSFGKTFPNYIGVVDAGR